MFRQALNDFAHTAGSPPGKKKCEEKIDPTPYDAIGKAIRPEFSIPALLARVLDMPDDGWFSDPLKIKAALAYPDFEDAMYEKLKEISIEWLAPNLHLIPNNVVTLLEPNRKFIEAFMVGINVAMNQEMRWREYPTDERGSCFRQFWDVKGIKTNPGKDPVLIVEQFKDISPIDGWKNWDHIAGKEKLDEFGEHRVDNSLPENEQLVLVIRGDLLKCFPNTTIYAAQASEETYYENRVELKKRVIKQDAAIKFPAFKAEAGTDLKFIGFDLAASAAKGDSIDPGWFFVLQETPGEIRFGLDIQSPDPITSTWDDASWEFVNGHYISPDDDFSSITGNMSLKESSRWMRSSADMAYILYQKPVMIAIHANQMLP
ncbi:MAG: hypothetical protein ABI688_11320 [Bacteroidota bacterium]